MSLFFFFLFLKTPNTNRRKQGILQHELIKLLDVLFCFVLFLDFSILLVFRFSGTREGKSFFFINLSSVFVCLLLCLSVECPRNILIPQITKTATTTKKNGECHVDVGHARSWSTPERWISSRNEVNTARTSVKGKTRDLIFGIIC